jgi:probable ATP-dependent RNA helicase DDX4
MSSFGDGESNAGSNDGKEEREPVVYCPDYEANDDENIYDDNYNSGIDFEKYFNIPTKVTGKDVNKKISKFEEAGLEPKILTNIKNCKWSRPTPIQQCAIPNILKKRDIMACAQTGSGKTGAYAIPIISCLLKDGDQAEEVEDPPLCPQALILAPTRELAQQIQRDFVKLCRGTPIKAHYIVGGHAVKHQLERIMEGCNILVATPGRLNDFVGKNKIGLDQLKFLVLDEADRMLDMGFKSVIDGMAEKIVNKDERTTLMFSATFPSSVQNLGKELLKDDYLFAAIGIVGGAASSVTQNIIACEKKEKFDKLKEILEPAKESNERTLIFVETKRQTDYIASKLCQLNYPATSIHGDRNQQCREEALRDFKKGTAPILISTNVAARGIDIPDVAHVVNFELPKEIDEYVHRIGRTGRCGHKGKATSFFDEENDTEIKEHLIKILADSEQVMPECLTDGGSGNNFNNETAAAGGGDDDSDGW